jgi:hypothetical protein
MSVLIRSAMLFWAEAEWVEAAIPARAQINAATRRNRVEDTGGIKKSCVTNGLGLSREYETTRKFTRDDRRKLWDGHSHELAYKLRPS